MRPERVNQNQNNVTKIDNDGQLGRYSDARFIGLAHRFNDLTSIEGKIVLIIHVSPGELVGLLTPVERTIDGVTYSFGFNIETKHQAETIANVYIKIASDSLFDERASSMDTTLEGCHDSIEAIGVMEGEINFIHTRLENFFTPLPWDDRDTDKDSMAETTMNHHYRQAYHDEKRKKTHFPYPFSSIHIPLGLPDHFLNTGILLMRTEGRVDRLIELHLTRLLDQAKMHPLEFHKRYFQLPLNGVPDHVQIHGRGGSDQFYMVSDETEVEPAEAKRDKIYQDAVALYCYYLGKYGKVTIDDKTLQDLAIKFNWNSEKSVKKLKLLYNAVLKEPESITVHSSHKRNYDTRVRNFEQALGLLALHDDPRKAALIDYEYFLSKNPDRKKDRSKK
jgi:hypothetical protein